MAHVCIACESDFVDAATSLADTIRGLSHHVCLDSRERYPVADAMTLYLGQLDRDFDVAFIVISTSHEASCWILKELRLRHLYPKCLPVLLDNVAAPDSWPDDAPLMRFADVDSAAVTDLLSQP